MCNFTKYTRFIQSVYRSGNEIHALQNIHTTLTQHILDGYKVFIQYARTTNTTISFQYEGTANTTSTIHYVGTNNTTSTIQYVSTTNAASTIEYARANNNNT